jgi:quercetin dioxygenase-like cupin family protein
MKTISAIRVAEGAVAATTNRPATSVVHDVPDARLVVFRIAPGQAVSPHHNASTVILTVLGGAGVVSGADAGCAVAQGDVVAFEPNETHGMRAIDRELVLLATITPRPGTRTASHAMTAGAIPLTRGAK